MYKWKPITFNDPKTSFYLTFFILLYYLQLYEDINRVMDEGISIMRQLLCYDHNTGIERGCIRYVGERDSFI